MEGKIKDLRKSFREVTYHLDMLRIENMQGVSEAFMELESALINFDKDLDEFLNEIKEEIKND